MKTDTLTRRRREDFAWFTPITTRWHDNDIYGHVNNAVYYSYIDSVANRYLIEKGVLDIHTGDVVGVAVESLCRYFFSVAYPESLQGGLRVTHVGRTSVRYEIGIFRETEPEAAAVGYFVHVFVNRTNQQPVPVPANFRAAIESIYRSFDASE